MTTLLKNLALALAVLAVTVTLAGGVPNSPAFAQTAAPAASAPLAEATVKALQEALNKQGIAVKADGVLGDETRAAIRQYQSQHHLPVSGEPDKATLDKLGVAGQGSEASGNRPAAGSAAGQGTGGMPGMMGMMGGQGMMGQGGMPGMMGMMGGQGMMGQGGMAGMMGMMGDGMGGAAGQNGMAGVGPGALYGMPRDAQQEMTPERVRTWLEQQLARHGNPRLKIGQITAGGDGTTTAEILTVDGSLVQKLAFNRYPGFVRQITE